MQRHQVKTVLVTGAGGMGRDCVVEHLHRRGAQVAFAYNADDRASVEAAHALRDRLHSTRRNPTGTSSRSKANGTLLVPGVVTRMADVQGMVMAVHETLGSLDALVTLTPPAQPHALLSLTEETWTQEFADPVKGLWLAARAVVPAMIEHGGGHILHILSSACRYPGAQLTPHCAAQGAGAMFTRALAAECEQYRICVNAVATPMLVPPVGSNGHPGVRDVSEEHAAWKAVAATVDFLLLSAGAMTTGQTIVLGGHDTP